MFLKKTLILMAAILLTAAMACPVFAAEPATALLPVTCKAEGIGETFTYTIEPLSDGQEFEIVKDTLSLKDNGSDMFRLRFTQPGIYSFRIRQTAGSDRTVQYDKSVYMADVHVFTGENGELYTEVVAYAEGSGQKTEEVSFVNTTAKVNTTAEVNTTSKVNTISEEAEKESTGESAKESAKGAAGSVRTGDGQDAFLYFGLCAAALLMILCIVIGEKRRRAVVLMAMFLFLMPAAQVYAAPAEGATVSHSGTNGTTTWEIYSDGTLVIRPTNGTEGYMHWMQIYTDVPWYNYRGEVTSVETQGKIRLGRDAEFLFYDMTNPDLMRIDVSGFDTSAVENMADMFCKCGAKTITGLSDWDTSKLLNIHSMFERSGAETLDLSGWDVSKVQLIKEVFSGAKAKTIDLTGWDVSAATDMFGLFLQAEATTIKGLEDWDVSNVSNMKQLFKKSQVTNLDLSKWDTSAATDMESMFESCEAVSLGDISGWKTSNVSQMTDMFCFSKVRSLDLSGWDVSNTRHMVRLFHGCRAESLDLSGWDTSGANRMQYMFYQSYASDITLGADFRFKGNGITASSYQQAKFATPPSSITTGKWIREDGSVPAQTPEELRESYDENAGEWAGKWVWEVKSSSAVVSFNAEGGYTPQEQIKLSAPGPVTMPQAARPAYALTQWNTKADGTGAAYQPGETFTPEGGTLTIFYAQWESAAQYTVRHYQQDLAQTGYDLVETESFYAKKNSSVTPQVKTYAGFISPAPQTAAVAADDSTVVDYRYDRTSFTVHFEGNGASSGEVSDQPFIGGIVQRLSDNKFRKENAVFNGWNTKADGSGTVYGDAQTVINLAGNGETLTLYAQWMDIGNAAHEPTSGKYTVKVRPGETVTIPQLPAGTKYKITEKDIPPGWEQSTAKGTEGVVGSNETSAATVTNRYSASGTVTLKAYKGMTNAEPEKGQFSFQLLQGGSVIMTAENGDVDMAEEIPSDDGETTLKNPYYGLSVVNFENIPISSAGTHTFTIREVEGNDDGMEYDDHAEEVTVNAIDNGDGTLTCTAVYDSDGPVFVNSRIPVFEDSVGKGNLVIQKDVSNLASSQIFPFTVNLYDASGTQLTKAFTCDIVKRGHENDYRTGDQCTLSAVSYTENLSVAGEQKSNYGNYWNNSNIRGTGRDSASSEAHVITLEGATQLQVTIVFGSEGASWDWMCMWQGAHSNYTAKNNYSSSVTGKLGGGNHTSTNNTKTFTVPGDSVTFSFNTDSSYCGDGYGYYAVVTAQIDTLEYHEGFISSQEFTSGSSVNISEGQSAVIRKIDAGASYKVTEGETAGYELVNAEGTEGTITADAAEEASFTNVYDGRGQAPIRMQKIFTSGIISGGEFSFRLLDEGGKLIDETTNDAGGGIAFKPIEYTIEDIGKRYRYTVIEVPGDDPDVVYDTHEEEVTVEVSDGGDGNLIADVQYQDHAVFTNRSTVGMIRVRKIVEGNMGDRSAEFDFTARLTDCNDRPFERALTYTKGEESGTLTPDAEGKVTFALSDGEEIIFGLPLGTTYTITETRANSDGYLTTAENAEGTVIDENADIVFTNSRNVSVFTEGAEKVPRAVFLFPAAGILSVLISYRRRKKK